MPSFFQPIRSDGSWTRIVKLLKMKAVSVIHHSNRVSCDRFAIYWRSKRLEHPDGQMTTTREPIKVTVLWYLFTTYCKSYHAMRERHYFIFKSMDNKDWTLDFCNLIPNTRSLSENIHSTINWWTARKYLQRYGFRNDKEFYWDWTLMDYWVKLYLIDIAEHIPW